MERCKCCEGSVSLTRDHAMSDGCEGERLTSVAIFSRTCSDCESTAT